MAGEKRYTRIPPESTGDRVYMIHTAEIEYSSFNAIAGGSTDHSWKIGERYDIQDFFGGDVHIHGVYDRGDGTGILAVHYNKKAKFENETPATGKIISYENQSIAQVVSAYDVYIPAQNIMGYDNPEYGWDIDRFGAGLTTFSEGPPQITGTGALRVNDGFLLASYDFSKSNLPNEFTSSREGGNAVTNTWDPTTRGVKLSVGTASGDRVTQTSNLYHSFEDGGSNLYILAARSGDSGTANVVRAWGAFDVFDGYFFELNGSDASPGDTMMGAVSSGVGTALRVIHRYSVGGSVVNHAILQKDWNRDTLLGSGTGNPSGMQLDVTKINAYWIDYQYLGGGRTRWGVYYNGERIVCHEVYHGNGEEGVMTQNHNPIANPSRPICWAIENTGVTGDPSNFYAYGGSVIAEQKSDPLKSAQQVSLDYNKKMWGRPHLQPYWRLRQSRNGNDSSFPALLRYGTGTSGGTPRADTTQYMFTMSPVQFLETGDENHTVYQPLTFQLSNHRFRDNAPRVAEIRAFYGCINRGYSFSDEKPSVPTVDVDESADHLAHVIQIGRFVVNGNDSFEFDKFSDNFQYGTVRNLSDQVIARNIQPIDSFVAQNDLYSTGVNRVLIEVGKHPVFGDFGLTDRHYFWDKQPISIRQPDGDEVLSEAFSTATTFAGFKTSGGAGYASVDRVDNPADWHFLSYVSSRTAWLYNSQADIDDDRLARTIDVDDCLNLQIGQRLTVATGPAAGATCAIMKIDVTGTVIPANQMIGGEQYQVVTVADTDYVQVGAVLNAPGEIFTATGQAIGGLGTVVPLDGNPGTLTICARGLETAAAANATVSALDVGLTSGTFTTDGLGSDGPGAGNITASSTSTVANDYWTSLKALQYDADLGMDAAEDLGPGLIALYGNPPPRAAWTFMIKWLENENEDGDGDAGPVEENSITNWNIFWRERLQ